jgi:glycine betaine/proline transport system substrate-binding protein
MLTFCIGNRRRCALPEKRGRELMTTKTKLFAGLLAIGTGFAALMAPAQAAGDPESCKAIRFADVGWTDIQVITGIASIMFDALGYQSEVKTLSVPVTYASMKNKDIDAFLGNWMPSMTADVKPYFDDKSVEQLSVNLEGAGYGVVVPQYVADAGVKSITDLAAHKDKFGGKFYGIEAGNDGNRIISTMIADAKNKLEGFELVESSEAGMLTEAEKAMKNEEWIAFLGWTPHPIMGEMKIHYLDGVAEYGFGGATVHTNVRAGYTGECPNAGKLLSNYKFDLKMEGEMMAPVLKDGADPKETAMTWMKANQEKVLGWLDGVTTIDGGDAKAAVTAALAN